MPNDSNQQPISDDQELAKVLAGVSQQSDDSSSDDTPVLPPVLPGAVLPSTDSSTAASEDDNTTPELPTSSEVPQPTMPEPVAESSVSPLSEPSGAPVVSDELDTIKQQALGELRPLVDKLNVSPEEKFDTYLLLLRSTDDKDLIAPAHDAAKAIGDEARRAQALLDIIKEIDFLSQNQ